MLTYEERREAAGNVLDGLLDVLRAEQRGYDPDEWAAAIIEAFCAGDTLYVPASRADVREDRAAIKTVVPLQPKGEVT